MPVTTRSQSSGIFATEYTGPAVSPLSKTATKTSRTVATNNDKLNLAGKPSRRFKRTQKALRRSRKPSSIPQTLGQKKQSPKAGCLSSSKAWRLSSPELPNSTLTHWPCEDCPCPQGAFDYPVDNCIRCGHTMDDHEDRNHPWKCECDYVCERPDLVHSIIQLVQLARVVVIRATPQVGKTTLLRLLGRHIFEKEKDLEPVFFEWKRREGRNGLPYQQYLEQQKSKWQEDNAKHRPYNPRARTVYLIDEAQNSYEEEELWSQTLKNRNTRRQDIFILVCLYGAVGTSRSHEPHIESQASLMDRFQRVELRPSMIGNPHMLFTAEETAVTIQKWAIQENFKLTPGTCEYFHMATGGHPGMVGMVLHWFAFLSSEISKKQRRTRIWSPESCHEALVEQDDLIRWFENGGRGLWIGSSETLVKGYLRHPRYSDLRFSEIAKALRKVVTSPNGYTRVQRDFDAFAFCYKMGYLHSEPPLPGSEEVTYVFASPLHRRVAYRRLCPGHESGINSQNISLRQTCLNAISRFSPSVFRLRGQHRNPEAIYQDELYCCLSYELQSLPILSEYSHTRDGRLDFYIFDKKWGIEVLQSKSKANITEHIRRFQTGGKYQEWNILDDYIILNFCPKAAIQEIKIEDTRVQPHFLQIAIDPAECTAEVYTSDKQLRATIDLGEGRRRYSAGDGNQLEEDYDAVQSLQGQLIQAKRENEDMVKRLAELEKLTSQR